MYPDLKMVVEAKRESKSQVSGKENFKEIRKLGKTILSEERIEKEAR